MDLARHWAGKGGIPVVCLPSFSTDRKVTAAAFDQALSTAGGLRRCYVDLPGHGESPAGPATSDGVVDELSGFVDREIPGRRFLLAGWSYGAYIAMALARRRPADVAGMLLVCPGVNMADRDLPPGPAGPDEAGWLDDVPDHLRNHLSMALGTRTREMARQVSAVLAASASADQAYLERLRANGYRLSDEDSAVPFPGPASIVTGRQDRIVGYADQFRRLACFPAGTFTVLDRAGHYLPFEQPRALSALAGDWRSRCPAS
jgi:pimeloyl-ACP methyl ester carboxylesterase